MAQETYSESMTEKVCSNNAKKKLINKKINKIIIIKTTMEEWNRPYLHLWRPASQAVYNWSYVAKVAPSSAQRRWASLKVKEYIPTWAWKTPFTAPSCVIAFISKERDTVTSIFVGIQNCAMNPLLILAPQTNFRFSPELIENVFSY